MFDSVSRGPSSEAPGSVGGAALALADLRDHLAPSFILVVFSELGKVTWIYS